VPKGQEAAYLSFARELALTIRKPPVPDFTRKAKRIVLKWFKRGLSGKLLYKLGCAVIAWRFKPEKGVKWQKARR